MAIYYRFVHRRTNVALVSILTGLTVVGLIVAIGAAVASASPYPPTSGCAVSSLTGSLTPGEPINLVGSGFPSNTTLRVRAGTVSLGSVRADATGAFTAAVNLPASTPPSTSEIVVSSASMTCSLALSSAGPVRSAGTAVPVPPSGLASTGFAILTAGLVALLLLFGGLFFVVIGRRRGD